MTIDETKNGNSCNKGEEQSSSYEDKSHADSGMSEQIKVDKNLLSSPGTDASFLSNSDGKSTQAQSDKIGESAQTFTENRKKTPGGLSMDLNASKNLTNQRARAAEYFKRGWAPIPVKFKGEEPIPSDWQNLRMEEKDIDPLFRDEPTNIGVLLGKASGGLVDVHIVDKDARRFADDFLPLTGMTFGPASARSSHRLFRIDHCEPCKWGAAGFGTIVDLRGNGQITVFPDSIDESGEPIAFEKDYGPEDFCDDDLRNHAGNAEAYLKDCLIPIPVATVLYKRWNPEDPSSLVQSMTKYLWGRGWPDTTIERLIHVVEREAGTSGQEEACRAVFKETCRAGRSGLADCLGEETVRDIENWDFLHF